MTVLANEQVIDGRGWRSGAVVERRELTQWFFRISDYSGELLAALDGLQNWPEKVRTMQANWIGKSRGLQFAFQTAGAPTGFDRLEVYTTRPDTLLGASFAAISPDHPLAKALEAGVPQVAAFVAACRRGGTSAEAIETAEKKGFDTGITVRHPFDPDWHLPVYIANFILMDYGTGAIFGCPAHDARDFEFATRYGLPIPPVFVAEGQHEAPLAGAFVPAKSERVRYLRGFAGDAVQTGEAAVAAAIAACEAKGIGRGVTNYRLRDWGLSRQRYWAARFRWCIAPAAAWCRSARKTCLCACPMMSPSTSRAIRWTAIRPGATWPAPPAAGLRGARRTRWIPLSIRPGTMPASPRPMPQRRPLRKMPPTG